jgi:alkylation response protein AidB-like acyl-CoA dehydrogenase
MDFELDEDLRMLRDMARDFADRELAPRARAHDKEEAIGPAILAQMGELGLWGLTIPEEHGGAGLGNLHLALVLEEINRACAATGVTLSVHNSLVAAPLRKFGSEELKRRWLPKLASGEVVGAYCLSEANSGSDAAALRAQAKQDGDAWVLNGTKLWVTNGGIAGVFIVYARTDPAAPKAKGISAFVIGRDTPGLSVGKHEHKTGIRGSTTTEVLLDNCRVPASAILGELHRGFPLAMDTLDGGRIGIAAQAVGIAQACLDASVKYSKERQQFNQPIGNFQAIQWKLADMSAGIEASRMLTHKAAWLRDRGLPCARAASQAKLFASRHANWCADECLQIHGGAGYTDDFHVERLFRDARITEIYEGVTDIQRLVIARSLLG